MKYNTNMNRLILPEYGRNVQQMVDYCVQLPDKEARTECAYDIASILCGMFPELKPTSEKPGTVWDVINILSDFKIDIDFPCEVADKEKLMTKPEPISSSRERIRFRHYGNITEKMIEETCMMDEGEDKEEMIWRIANHMKLLMCSRNSEDVDDRRIFSDLEAFSLGRIKLDPETYILEEYKVESENQSSTQPKKKKKVKNRKNE